MKQESCVRRSTNNHFPRHKNKTTIFSHFCSLSENLQSDDNGSGTFAECMIAYHGRSFFYWNHQSTSNSCQECLLTYQQSHGECQSRRGVSRKADRKAKNESIFQPPLENFENGRKRDRKRHHKKLDNSGTCYMHPMRKGVGLLDWWSWVATTGCSWVVRTAICRKFWWSVTWIREGKSSLPSLSSS